VGNATMKTKQTFEYEVKNKVELDKLGIDVKKLETIPF
jgi:hypothetical protein